MRRHFHTEQWLPYSVETVFAFFSSPANLPRLLPLWQHARIESLDLKPPSAGPDSPLRIPAIPAGDGTDVTLSFRPLPIFPLRLRWVARIEDFRWNEGFCDRQLTGPFRYWRQCHIMRAAPSPKTGEPGTILEDQIEYELPLGALGRLADGLIVRRQIAGLFRYRHKRTAELLPQFAATLFPH